MIGDNIRRKREQLGLSQEELARAVKTTQQTIQRIETNKSPRSSYIEPLLKHLDLKVDNAPVDESSRDKAARRVLIGSQKPRQFPMNWKEMAELIRFRRTEDERSRGSMEVVPIFGMGWDPAIGPFLNKNAVEFMDRPEPLAYSMDAYAVKIAIDRMYPALKVSEIALVNPDLSPFRDEPHIFLPDEINSQQTPAVIGNLEEITADKWRIKQFSPEALFQLDRSVFPVCHRIVGKFSRS